MYFEKTENKRMKYGIELVQIRYTKDNPFFNVKAGQLGGWVSEKAYLEQNGKWFLHENAEVYGSSIYGGSIYGGRIYGGWIYGGRIDGDFPKDFGKVPYLEGGKYPVNFAGYSKEGERKFACGCQIYEKIKWTPEFMKTLSKKFDFLKSELEICMEMYSLLKKITPKKDN